MATGAKENYPEPRGNNKPALRDGQIRMRISSLLLIAALTAAGASSIMAQTASPEVGPDSGLPLPRFVSLKTGEANARRGPSLTHRVDWLYTRRDLPLMVTGEYEHWRRVEDSEGQGGWVFYTLLSGVRTVVVQNDMTPIRSNPQTNAHEVALLETGVVAHIMECEPEWCRLSIDGTRGWVHRGALWGLLPNEVLD